MVVVAYSVNLSYKILSSFVFSFFLLVLLRLNRLFFFIHISQFAESCSTVRCIHVRRVCDGPKQYLHFNIGDVDVMIFFSGEDEAVVVCTTADVMSLS